jgi:hypothetical protein
MIANKQIFRNALRYIVVGLVATIATLVVFVIVVFVCTREAQKDPLLNRYADETCSRLEKKPYSYWIGRDYPINYEKTVKCRELQVEVDAWEIRPDYVHILVAVDDGYLTAYMPLTRDFITKKK